MSDDELSTILDRCLEQIAAGETVSACLAAYPEHAAELAPMLAMAGELRTLSSYRLSETARQRTHAALRQVEAVRRARRPAPWWQRALFASRAAAGLAAALLCVVLTVGLVAASQPGDLAYGVRVVVERAPALLADGADARAWAELAIASRRLADLDRTMSGQQQALDARAVSALLASAESAAQIAVGLPEPEGAAIAVLIGDQANALAQLGRAARQPEDAEALLLASERAQRAAERVWRGVPMPDPQHGPSASATVGPQGIPAPEGTPSPQPRAAETESPTPAQAIASPTRATPSEPGPSVTAPGPGPRATSPGPAGSATPSSLGPSATAPGPGVRATSPGPTASATPSGPGPSATSQGPGATGAPSGPGQDGTSPGPGGQRR
jgi:hypothetical protein